jgi:Allene oxide cyclase barrel like domain
MKNQRIDVRSIGRWPLTFQVIAMLALSALCATAWGDNNRVIRLISTCTAINKFVDIGPPGPSTGDLYVWVDDVFTRDGSQKVGEAFGRCNLIDPTAGSFGCTTVGVFTNGSTITLEGILYNVPGIVSVFAITGGTGDYRGATGESTVELGSPCGPHNITLTLHGLPSP